MSDGHALCARLTPSMTSCLLKLADARASDASSLARGALMALSRNRTARSVGGSEGMNPDASELVYNRVEGWTAIRVTGAAFAPPRRSTSAALLTSCNPMRSMTAMGSLPSVTTYALTALLNGGRMGSWTASRQAALVSSASRVMGTALHQWGAPATTTMTQGCRGCGFGGEGGAQAG